MLRKHPRCDVLLRIDSKRRLTPSEVSTLGLTPVMTRNVKGVVLEGHGSFRWNFRLESRSRNLETTLRDMGVYLSQHHIPLRKIARHSHCAVSILVKMPEDWVACSISIPHLFIMQLGKAGVSLDVCTGIVSE